MWQWLKHIRVK